MKQEKVICFSPMLHFARGKDQTRSPIDTTMLKDFCFKTLGCEVPLAENFSGYRVLLETYLSHVRLAPVEILGL